eukprot:scaffold27997_cov65-Phaeocystis_antarctica.AAC.3
MWSRLPSTGPRRSEAPGVRLARRGAWRPRASRVGERACTLRSRVTCSRDTRGAVVRRASCGRVAVGVGPRCRRSVRPATGVVRCGRRWTLCSRFEHAHLRVIVLARLAHVQKRLCHVLPVDCERELLLCIIANRDALVASFRTRDIVLEVVLLVAQDRRAHDDHV